MCLIIAVEECRELSHDKLALAIESATWLNTDGIGITYPQEGKVVIEKTVKNYRPIIKKAIELYTHTSLPFALHLRYNTVGTNSKQNTHPFKISDSVSMVHNKTLDIEPPTMAWSDSRTVAELLRRLCKADRSFFGSPLFYSFMEHQAGPQNRFVFLDADQESLTYINDDLGIMYEGIWFSNTYSWDPTMLGIRPKSKRTKLYEQAEGISHGNIQDRDDYGLTGDSDDLPLAWELSGAARGTHRDQRGPIF